MRARVFNPPDFYDDALCAQTDPELFFPERGGSIREPVSVCNGCQVREQCLAWALDMGEQWGVWGGVSERDRMKMRRARKVALKAAS